MACYVVIDTRCTVAEHKKKIIHQKESLGP